MKEEHKAKKKAEKAKKKLVEVSNIINRENHKDLNLLKCQIHHVTFYSLADLGATNSLITEELANETMMEFEPVEVTMKVAGGELLNNIIGKKVIELLIFNDKNKKVSITTEVLVARNLNGYSAIIGNNLLSHSKISNGIISKQLMIN